MALIDRYEMRTLSAAGTQILLFLCVLIYGLWSPSLGMRIVWPTVAMLPAWAWLLWLTLNRPWDWGGLEPRDPLHRMWGYWEGGVVYGCMSGVVTMHLEMLSEAKEWAAEIQARSDNIMERIFLGDAAEEWATDTLGYLVLSGRPGGWICVAGALFIVAIAWFLLPR